MSAFFHIHPGHAPHFNMAFDEWLLERVREQPDEVHLRLYSWSEGAITIGINQDLTRAVDLDHVGETPVIRRVTGGRALFHDISELTYAVALNLDGCPSGMATGRSVLYRAIASALVCFLGTVGIESNYAGRSSREFAHKDSFHRSPCFASTARYEVTSEIGKVVASAACWRGQSLMQHGSIKIGGIASHLALPEVGKAPRPRAEGAVGASSFTSLAKPFERAFVDQFGLTFAQADIPSEERAQIQKASEWIKKNPTSARL